MLSAFLGILWCFIEPTIPFALLGLFALVVDCISAWRLSRRVARKYPEKNVDGKFKSEHASKMMSTLLMSYSCILIAHGVDVYILPHIVLYLGNYVAAIFCLIQLASILENESSCNGATWAVAAQKILADKTKRHLNIELPVNR